MNRKILQQELESYGMRYPAQLETAVIMCEALHRPDVFYRSALPGHFTASAIATDPNLTSLLLIHHRKLQIWMQPGGHADGDEDLLRAAQRELQEETGITKATAPYGTQIFDIDIHEIPPRKDEPAHLHLDVRYLFIVRHNEQLIAQECEVSDLRWVALDDLNQYSVDNSVMRPRDKLTKLHQTSLAQIERR